MPPLLPRSAGAAAIAALVVAASGFSFGSATIPDPGGRAEVQVNLSDPRALSGATPTRVP